MDALDRVIEILGSQRAVAEAVGVGTAMAVSQWRRRGVPPHRCRALEKAVHGKVTVHELRPDIFGPPPSAPEPVDSSAGAGRAQEAA